MLIQNYNVYLENMEEMEDISRNWNIENETMERLGREHIFWTQYLYANMTKEKAINIMNNLKQCKCCLRHQTKRHCEAPPQKKVLSDKSCECRCRHYYRTLSNHF